MGKIMGLISGSNPYLLAGILAIGIAMGGYVTYKIQRGNVLKLELAIANQKIEAAKILAVETSKVAVAEENQRKSNVEKDKNYAKLKEDSIVANNQLNDTINGLRFQQRGPSSSGSNGEGDSTGFNTADESQYTLVSKKLLIYLAGESKRADQDGIDKNRLLDFVKQDNCGIPKNKV